MTPEHLELYKALAKTRVYQERFGGWHAGDRYWFAYHKKIYLYDERHSESPFMKDVIWLPPVFDPERPERSLLGMLGSTNIDYVDNEEAYLHCAYEIGPDRLDIALIKTILAQEASHD